MIYLSDALARDGHCLVHFCPGCGYRHRIDVYEPNPHTKAMWSWDGNLKSPTFTPSINIVGFCHYFIRNGQIQYCADSAHALAGQTVPLPPMPTDLQMV